MGTKKDPTGSAAVYHWKNDGENSEKRMQRMKLLKIRSYTDEAKRRITGDISLECN